MAIALNTIDQLTRGKLGTFDVPCPECGPLRRAARSQRKPVLRVYRTEANFAGYHCARCGEQGFARDGSAPTDPIKLAKTRAEAAERDRILKAERLGKAQWLWSIRRPIAGSVAETYLRSARGYGGPLPATLGFLPARREHPLAMIGAFGFAREIEPGIIAIADSAVTGVHLTRLLPDGSGKAVFDDPDENAKIMIGFSVGSPIVLAAPNDLLGQAITEGIEDGLSVHEATGLGTWAAGSAARMPALADALPTWIDCATVVADDDKDGRRHASALACAVETRGIGARLIVPSAPQGQRHEPRPQRDRTRKRYRRASQRSRRGRTDQAERPRRSHCRRRKCAAYHPHAAPVSRQIRGP
jgi:Toprim domain